VDNKLKRKAGLGPRLDKSGFTAEELPRVPPRPSSYGSRRAGDFVKVVIK
jgi:hypothetical protein